jgi:lysophospholipase L1-like esterase
MKPQAKNLLIGLAIGFTLVGLGFFAFRKKKSTKINSILFVGDSNTFANFSYGDKLKKLFPNLIIKKIAKNGANTDWMNEQLRNELKSYKYDIVSILAGSNDVYGLGKIDRTKKNLDEMYNLAHTVGAKVIAITPPNKNFYKNKTDAKQNLLSDLVDWIMTNKKSDYKIDFYKLTNDKSLFSKNDDYLHPQSNAHDLLVDEIKEQLNLA